MKREVADIKPVAKDFERCVECLSRSAHGNTGDISIREEGYIVTPNWRVALVTFKLHNLSDPLAWSRK